MAVRRAKAEKGEEHGLLDSFFGIVEVESGTGGFGEVFGSLRKGSGWMLAYPVIDMQKTGLRLKRECEARHVTIPEIREFLGLAAAQSIYGWFQGKALPSLDNFYALSCYLGLRMCPGETLRKFYTGARKGVRRADCESACWPI